MENETITIVASQLGEVTSGQSRFALNIAIALRRLGRDVGLLALSVNPSIRTRLASLGIAVQSRSVRTQSPAFQARLLTRWNTAGQALASMAASSRAPSWYVVISDEAVDFARHLSDRTCAYLSNGDLSLLAFS